MHEISSDSSIEVSYTNGGQNSSSQVRVQKRKMNVEELISDGQKYSRLEKPYYLIRYHVSPYHKRTNQLFMEHTSKGGRNFRKCRKTKKNAKGSSTAVDRHPYNISLFDLTLNSESFCEEKGNQSFHIKDRDSQNTEYYEVLKWEKELIHDHLDSLKAMFEFKGIYIFIHAKKKMLNFSDVPLYIIERMFLMPQESTHLASIMTGLLNHCFRIKGYSPEAPMPYKLWNSYLKLKVGKWYDLVTSFGGDTIAAANYICFDHDFFVILGSSNPLQFCDFHGLNILQRVWLVKSLCDSLMCDEEISEGDSDDGDAGSFDCPWLGTDRHGCHYFYLSYFKGQENLRVYRLYKYFIPVSGSFYDRIRRENDGQVAPCKKYHELVADDVQSLRRLANEFAEHLGTEEVSDQDQKPGMLARPECEAKLHQQLLNLLGKMEPLELKLKSSTLKMLMLLKSDWDRYHRGGLFDCSQNSPNEDVCELVDLASSSDDERSDHSDLTPPVSAIQHFLISVVRDNKRNIPKLKSILPHLRNNQINCKCTLPNVHITPLKKLCNGSEVGVEILTAAESQGSNCGRAKQIIVYDSRVNFSGEVAKESSGEVAKESSGEVAKESSGEVETESSTSNDNVVSAESDTPEDNVLNADGTVNGSFKTESCCEKNFDIDVLSSNSLSCPKFSNEQINWETLQHTIMADNSADSFYEVPMESSNCSVTHKSITLENMCSADKNHPIGNDAKQAAASRSESDLSDFTKQSLSNFSENNTASKHQPVVIYVGNHGNTETKIAELSIGGKSQDKNLSEGLQNAVASLKVTSVKSKCNNTKDSPPQPKTSAFSVKYNVKNHQSTLLSRINTARKSIAPSHKQTVSSFIAAQKRSTVNHGESHIGTPTHSSTSSNTGNTSFFVKSAVRHLDVDHITSDNRKIQSPVRMLKAADTYMLSKKIKSSSRVTQSTKFPIICSRVTPPSKMSGGSMYPIIKTSKKIDSCYETTKLNDTFSKKSTKTSVDKPVFIVKKSGSCFIQSPIVTSSDLNSFSHRISSFVNQSQSSGVAEEHIYIEISNESSQISNMKISGTSFPVSQQLIYTLSPMKTSFTTRNSLETRISATKDPLCICDDGEKFQSLATGGQLCRSDVLTGIVSKNSIDVLESSAKNREVNDKNENTPTNNVVSSCKPSPSHGSVATIPSSPLISGNSSECSVTNLPQKSGDHLNLKKLQFTQKSTSPSLSFHQNTTVSSPPKHVYKSAAGTDANTNSKISDSPAVSSEELIPVILPDGKNILLRLVNSQTAPSSKMSLVNSSKQLSLLKNTSQQATATELHKNNSNDLDVPTFIDQSTSLIKTSDVSHALSKTASPAHNVSEKDPSFADDNFTESKDGKVKIVKLSNKNFSTSSELFQSKSSSKRIVSISKSKKKARRKISNLQEMQNLPESSHVCVGAVRMKKTRKFPSKCRTSSSKSSSLNMPKVKKVKIPLMASKILSSLSSCGTISAEISSKSSSAIPSSSANYQTMAVNSSATGGIIPGPYNNILNAYGTSGGFIILGQQIHASSGNNMNEKCTVSQPISDLTQNSLFLVPSMANSPSVQLPSVPTNILPMATTGFTTSVLLQPGSNNVISSSSNSNTQPVIFYIQNQLFVGQPVITSNILPANALVPPNSSQTNSSVDLSAAPRTSYISFCNSARKVSNNTNCNNNVSNEVEDSWEVVSDPLELRKVQSSCLGDVTGYLKLSASTQKKAGSVVSGDLPLPEFPANKEPPVLASNKKATTKYDLNLKPGRPVMTLDEPITVIPYKKENTE